MQRFFRERSYITGNLKNYMSALIFGALAIRTITVETGEIAPTTIVPTTEARHFANAAE